jgi:hypothetical protein
MIASGGWGERRLKECEKDEERKETGMVGLYIFMGLVAVGSAAYITAS